ncbi:MAG TPA: MarR family transcriptional regulator [Allosphingosinicella sp.]|nr:MarR family transcriptional regulator [Allosphingosinicella sp.]
MSDAQLHAMAGGLHSAAIRLLRMVRREDRHTGISPPRLSALSVLVFGGPKSLAELAAAEEVTAPTMSRIVEGLVADGLATREADRGDRRKVRIAASDEGRRRLEAARERRVRTLAARLGRLGESERRALARGAEVLERALR